MQSSFDDSEGLGEGARPTRVQRTRMKKPSMGREKPGTIGVASMDEQGIDEDVDLHVDPLEVGDGEVVSMLRSIHQ